jgi:hypothetical protein
LTRRTAEAGVQEEHKSCDCDCQAMHDQILHEVSWDESIDEPSSTRPVKRPCEVLAIARRDLRLGVGACRRLSRCRGLGEPQSPSLTVELSSTGATNREVFETRPPA